VTPGVVLAVAASPAHGFSKPSLDRIRLLEGLGVEGDAHCGTTVKHRSRVAKDPSQPNLRQLHLIHAELFGELAAAGFRIDPGAMGENVTTRGLDLLALPRGARLHLGATAIVEVTGLRNPCRQLDAFRKGLMAACLGRDAAGGLVRKTGVMAVVVAGGEVVPGDAIRVVLPAAPHERLGVV
jgi:MOSC domain-containing protein YiiM